MKNKHYVGLMLDCSVRYVTQVDWMDKSALWESDKPALALPYSHAKDLLYGLRSNGFKAVIITMPDYEQPCNPAKEE